MFLFQSNQNNSTQIIIHEYIYVLAKRLGYLTRASK